MNILGLISQLIGIKTLRLTIEKDIFHSIDNEAIMQRLQNMKTRRNQL